MSEIQVYNLGLGFESVNVVNEFIEMKPVSGTLEVEFFFFSFPGIFGICVLMLGVLKKVK